MNTRNPESPISDLALLPPRGFLGNLVQGWNRFWFNPTDPATLGLVRIVAGLLVLYVHLVYSTDLQALFGEDAWLNLQTINEQRAHVPINAPPDSWSMEMVPVDEGRYIWSMWFHVTDPRWMVAVHVAFLVVLLLFTIGFCTRVTSVLAFLASMSYIQRAQTTLFGMDTISNVLLLYLMIGPSGAAYSLDRLLARWRRARRGERPESLRTETRATANFALRLMQVHVSIIYFASGTSKLLGAAWWSGTATWGTMANYEFSPLDSKVYSSILLFLAQHRWLWELVMSGSGLFTLVLEIGFVFLVWNRRLRWVMVSAAVLLHLGIALFMGLTMFSLMMLTMLLAFVPAETVRRFMHRAVTWVPAVPLHRLVGAAEGRESVRA